MPGRGSPDPGVLSFLATSRRWRFLGDASYSLYLTHLLPAVIFRKLWVLGHLQTQGPGYALIFIAFTMGLAILVGAATYRYFEKPMLGYLRRRLRLRHRLAEPIADPQSIMS